MIGGLATALGGRCAEVGVMDGTRLGWASFCIILHVDCVDMGQAHMWGHV